MAQMSQPRSPHGSLPDAAPANWVDRLAPAPVRPWLRLGRFDRPTGIWLLMLPAWQGAALHEAAQGRWPSLNLLALFAIGAALMRAAGCAYNDIVDKDIDAKVARTAARPVASGAISVGAASAFAIACALGGLAILLQLNLLSLWLGLGSLVLIAAYPFMKRLTWWPQAWLGLTFNWGVLLGWAAAQGGASGVQALTFATRAWTSGINLLLYITQPPLAVFLLYASAALWTIGYDTIYAVQDIEDDALAGVKSSARRLGAMAPRAVLAFYIASIVLAFLAWRAAGLGVAFLSLWALYGAQLIWQAVSLRLHDPAGALRLFKSNTLAGLVLFGALLAGALRLHAA